MVSPGCDSFAYPRSATKPPLTGLRDHTKAGRGDTEVVRRYLTLLPN
jgi:hypothetical protein